MFLRLTGPRFLMKPDDDKGGGGGDPKDKGGAPDSTKEIADLKASNAALLARLEKLEGKSKGRRDDDQDDDDQDEDDDSGDLRNKARKQREADDKKANDTKALEAALRFSMGAESWLKQNQAILPKDIADIFKAAEKENYSNAIEKDAAIKAGVIQSFFSIQSNLDLLTPGLKSNLEDYLKLTKTGKQERAREIYDSIFEPAFDTLKRVKKAEALGKGFGASSTGDDAYKQKMMSLSKKHYLGEKSNGS